MTHAGSPHLHKMKASANDSLNATSAWFNARVSFRTISLASLMATAGLAGCSVLTDFTGLTGASDDAGASADTAGIEAGPDSSSDAAGDASAASDGTVLGDSGSEAGAEAGAWAFLASTTKSVLVGPITLSASASIQAGDLVIIGCDTSIGSDTLTLSGFSTIALPLTYSVLATSMSDEAVVAWGIAKQPIIGLTVTATATNGGQFIDCSINSYRGGNAATLVDHFASTGVGPGLVSCHAVSTVRGGVAYYIAARNQCAGMPALPFVQRNTINGNPNGDFAPADGNTVGTILGDCMASTGDWVCLMVSLSP